MVSFKIMKVIVGMSGGVDSSVAAYLLKQQGFEVVGVSFILYEARLKSSFTGCCSVEAINDAQRTADHIGVPHTRVDLRSEFLEKVIDPFITAYAEGRTPNPCILCNRAIKFPYLLKAASVHQADYIATGHYARIDQGLLKRAADRGKDQSYVLYILRTEELSRLLLPLGEKTKDEVRGIARNLDLPAAVRPESQEICFVENRNYCTFLEGLTEQKEGPIIDIQTGTVLGRHKGIHLYTVGQRKRLGIATGKPLFVARIDPARQAVYVGPRESAMAKQFMVDDVSWIIPKDRDFNAAVKVRSMMTDEPAAVRVLDRSIVQVTYDEPQWAPAPGQSAVFYEGDTVLGGGIIRAVA